MKLKSVFSILFGFNIFLLSLLILCTFLLFDAQSKLANSQEIRYKSYKVADELRQTSDDLTRFARTYVITGNKMYEDFFWEILAIRNGEKPRPENYERIYWDLVLDAKIRPRPYSDNRTLRSMMLELGFTEEEFQKLKQAQQNSDSLVSTETIAMNAMKGLYDDGKGNFIIKRPPNQKMAISLMHDGKYHSDKKEIMKPIDRFFEKLEKRTDNTVKEYQRKSIFLIVLMLVLVLSVILSLLLSSFIIRKKVSEPITELQTVAIGIGNQNWDISVTYRSNDEIGFLAEAFRISKEKISLLFKDLRFANSELQNANIELNQTLKKLNETQTQLVHSEKLAALGQVVAGVAHEINTPLGAIQASVENLTEGMDYILRTLPEPSHFSNKETRDHFFQLVSSPKSSVYFSSKEKRNLKKIIIENLKDLEMENIDSISDMLVDLGGYENLDDWKLLLKNSENQNLITLAHKIIRQKQNSDNIKLAVERAAKIIFALKTYSHQDHTQEKSLIRMADSIETVLLIYQNLTKKGVEVIREFEDVPEIYAYADELAQVWTNLIHNALQAMDYKGILNISINWLADKNSVCVGFKDTGKGIPLEIQSRIFEPFFTTKARGEGTGLGLEIAKRIVDKHDGVLQFESMEGMGTTFIVILPNKI
ncbi:ATP-binding protein [Leptospira sp. 'Mane']|uniref:ATP-binding protein n=1 Tax=Leptospira sp. 'Mane' TaxID=3387407 RepID=UPI00398B7D84